jgi:beta-glucanase (GH16 family)
MLRSVVLAALMGASSVLAVACSIDSKCPEKSPCCSQYGECGTGAFCLGGCDPRTSFSIDSCVPAPVCQDLDVKFDSLDSIQDISEYLGDSDKADWVASGEPAIHKDGVLLTMPRGSVGTVISSTNYMWYGNVKARMKTSRGRGVVTAFILFSDVKDEIDYEWVGVDLETSQTNFYFQGIPNYENSANISTTDSFNNFHDYEIRWTPDKIEWLIDGELGRTQERKDTWNKTAQHWDYPQTPARVQLSLWPGGLETNPKGTVDWAGGVIDWDHEDIKEVGYFWATVQSVTIECYNGDGIGSNKKESYIYNDLRGTNDTVEDTDNKHVLASLQATGLDMDKGKKNDDDDEDKNNDDDDEKDKDDEEDDEDEGPATVPGGISPGQDHSGEDQSEDNSSDNSGGNGGDEPPPPPGDSSCERGSFCQGLDESNSNSDGGNDTGDGTRSRASVLAIIVAGFALYWL